MQNTRFRLQLIGLCAVSYLFFGGSSAQSDIIVDSTVAVVDTGIVATRGEIFRITASGHIEMALPDPGISPTSTFQTDPNGTILVAPPLPTDGLWSVYYYMLDETGGTPAVQGGVVNVSARWQDGIGRLVGAPFGGLLAGFASTSTPTSLSDFVGGFSFVGASGFVTAPHGAPYLFLSINDTDRHDNVGSYYATASAVPEPSGLVLSFVSFFVVGLRRASRPGERGKVIVPLTPACATDA